MKPAHGRREYGQETGRRPEREGRLEHGRQEHGRPEHGRPEREGRPVCSGQVQADRLVTGRHGRGRWREGKDGAGSAG